MRGLPKILLQCHKLEANESPVFYLIVYTFISIEFGRMRLTCSTDVRFKKKIMKEATH